MSQFASQVVLHDLARPTPKDENACMDTSQASRTEVGNARLYSFCLAAHARSIRLCRRCGLVWLV